ncbi:MAG TPA: PaaI family thioesterase [Gaiellaceae bacterium]|nr:PaaI family thioesterase [Gaiellaceae bacterium]
MRTDHYPFCWGCAYGVDGLGFDWTHDGERLAARHVFSERFQGAPGIVHGGLVAALLDEACGQVARPAVSPGVTSRLEIRYLAPVPVEQEVRVGAELVGVEGRSATAEATVQDESGLLLAHAPGEVVQVRREYFLSTPQGRTRGTDWLPG